MKNDLRAMSCNCSSWVNSAGYMFFDFLDLFVLLWQCVQINTYSFKYSEEQFSSFLHLILSMCVRLRARACKCVCVCIFVCVLICLYVYICSHIPVCMRYAHRYIHHECLCKLDTQVITSTNTIKYEANSLQVPCRL